MKRWPAEISWRWYFWICPTNPKCQEEEQSCNRDHINEYLWSIINVSINIIAASQRFGASSTTAATADGTESLHGPRPIQQAKRKNCRNHSTNIQPQSYSLNWWQRWDQPTPIAGIQGTNREYHNTLPRSNLRQLPATQHANLPTP